MQWFRCQAGFGSSKSRFAEVLRNKNQVLRNKLISEDLGNFRIWYLESGRMGMVDRLLVRNKITNRVVHFELGLIVFG